MGKWVYAYVLCITGDTTGKCFLRKKETAQRLAASRVRCPKLESVQEFPSPLNLYLKCHVETSMVIQRVRICLVILGMWVQSLVRKLRSHILQGK